MGQGRGTNSREKFVGKRFEVALIDAQDFIIYLYSYKKLIMLFYSIKSLIQ